MDNGWDAAAYDDDVYYVHLKSYLLNMLEIPNFAHSETRGLSGVSRCKIRKKIMTFKEYKGLDLVSVGNEVLDRSKKHKAFQKSLELREGAP